ALNRATRLLGIGHGGQVLVSSATAELVRDVLPEGAELLDLGDHALKGLDRPERVFQLVAPGLLAEFPPLRSLERRHDNLPALRLPIIGRDVEIAQLGDL